MTHPEQPQPDQPTASWPPPPPTTQPQHGPTAYQPAYQPPRSAGPPQKRRTPAWLVVVIVLTVVVCEGGALTALMVTLAAGDPATPAPGDRQQEVRDEPDEEEPAFDYHVPTKGDFDLTVKTLSKECFGSAGCLVEFRIEVAYVSGAAVDPAKTWEITYEVLGGDEEYINTLTVTDGEYSTLESEMIGTASSDSKLRVEVLEVSEY